MLVARWHQHVVIIIINIVLILVVMVLIVLKIIVIVVIPIAHLLSECVLVLQQFLDWHRVGTIVSVIVASHLVPFPVLAI